MSSPIRKRLAQIDKKCSTVHAYLVRKATRKKTGEFREEERKLHKAIAAITEAREMLQDFTSENDKN